MMSHVLRQHPASEVLAIDAVANTPAGRDKNLIDMGGQYLLGFGPRTARAAWDLAVRLYGNTLKVAPDFADKGQE